MDFDASLQLLVYEADLNKASPAFFSLSGDAAEIQSGDCVTLNGLFAEKLGIKDNQEVTDIVIMMMILVMAKKEEDLLLKHLFVHVLMLTMHNLFTKKAGEKEKKC